MADAAALKSQARDCPGPAPNPHGPKRFTMPQGAVDTHAHVIGGGSSTYPLVADRSYTAPEATEQQYLAMLDATGSDFGILIQVSVHGTDNSLMIDTLRRNRSRLRGVAVVAPNLEDKDYAALKADNVVGLRINALFSGGPGLQALERYDAICQEMDWHLQLLLDARDLVGELGQRLSKLRSRLVVDHMGHFPASEGVQSSGFQRLLELVRDGVWVKLSGAYRLAEYPYRETTALARALMDIAPDRCVWGSDWPHVANWAHMPNVGDLLDLLVDWVPDEAARNRVLVDNPRRLYGFV